MKEEFQEEDFETVEGRKDYLKILELESEMKILWAEKLKKRGDEMPVCMGRYSNESTDQFIERYKKRREESNFFDPDYEEEYGDKVLS